VDSRRDRARACRSLGAWRPPAKPRVRLRATGVDPCYRSSRSLAAWRGARDCPLLSASSPVSSGNQSALSLALWCTNWFRNRRVDRGSHGRGYGPACRFRRAWSRAVRVISLLGEAVLRPQMERVRRITKKNEPADSYPVPKTVRPRHDISPISALRATIAGAREVWSHLHSKPVTGDTFWPNPPRCSARAPPAPRRGHIQRGFLTGPSCRRPADALHRRWINPELSRDLPHAGAPWLTQRGPYGIFLGLGQ
jgi:hypothetical protein